MDDRTFKQCICLAMSEVQNNKVIPCDVSFIMERDVVEYAGAIHNICGDYRSFKHHNGTAKLWWLAIAKLALANLAAQCDPNQAIRMFSFGDIIFELKMNKKQLERMAKKAEKEEKKEQASVRKQLADKRVESARVYAENAIRKKNECLQYLRFAARVDAVISRVQSAATMKSVTKQMEGVTKTMGKIMKTIDLEKTDKTMQAFEKTFEELDVLTSTVEGSMSDATTLSTPQDQMEALIRQVAAENDLQIEDQLAELNPAAGSLRAPGSATASKEDALERRLAQLRS